MTHKPGDRCKASGQHLFWDATSDRCPECGRVVRTDRNGKVPEHRVPRTLRKGR